MACLLQFSSKIPLLNGLSEYSFVGVPVANSLSIASSLYAYKLWNTSKQQEKINNALGKKTHRQTFVQKSPLSRLSLPRTSNNTSPVHIQAMATKKMEVNAAPKNSAAIIEECQNNPYRMTPVAYAVFRGYHDAAVYFIEQGADINTKTRNFAIRNRKTQEIIGQQKGFPLIMMAILNKDVALVDLLIKKGCKLDLIIPAYNNDLKFEQESHRIYISCNDSKLNPVQTSLQTWAIFSKNEQILESLNSATEALAEECSTYENPIFKAAFRGDSQKFATLLAERKYLLNNNDKLYILFCLMEGYEYASEQVREQKFYCRERLADTVILSKQLLRNVIMRGVFSPESIFLLVEKELLSPNEMIIPDSNQRLISFCKKNPELLQYLIEKGADISGL